jgi:xylan 1,4-beta-xylosidase
MIFAIITGMNPDYEIVQYKHGLNARILVHGINQYRLHWHKELELILVVKGSVFVTLNGQKHRLEEDDLFLINSEEIHSTQGNGENILAVLQIKPDFYAGLLPELNNRFFEWKTGTLPDSLFLRTMRLYISLIVEEYRKTEPGYELAIEGVLNSLVSLMIRTLPTRKKPDAEAIAGEDQAVRDRVKRITDYVQEHYQEKITLTDLANSAAYINPYYLSHFFKEKIGLSFLEYLNFVRLKNAVRYLSEGQKKITDIALDCGFGSIKAFNGAFKKQYGVTPRVYRKSRDYYGVVTDQPEYTKFDTSFVVQKLQKYIQAYMVTQTDAPPGGGPVRPVLDPAPPSTPMVPPLLPAGELAVENVEAAVAADAGRGTDPPRLFPRWRRLAAVGRAYDLLRADVQEQVREAVRELGISHLRFHGIFSDEMKAVSRDRQGKLKFSWAWIDAVLDFLTGLGVAAIPDCTFMPNALKSNNKTIFWYKGNVSPPRNLEDWALLIRNFALHCIERYGREEVRRWYFEVWNEPDMLWTGTSGDYYQLYKATAEALREADPELKVAGPSGLSHMTGLENRLDGFCDFINEHNVPLDCFTFHIYGEQNLIPLTNNFVPQYGGRDFTAQAIDQYRISMSRLKKPPADIFITEYNVSANHGNYIQDTMFTACYILYNFLKNHDKVSGIAIWTLSDVFEEDDEVCPLFGGGFGIVSIPGIHKPAWWALWFLRRLEGHVLARGDEYCITRQEDTITILAFRYVFFDNLFRQGDNSMLSYESRYGCFEQKPPARFTFTLEGLQGSWELREHTLDREHGSAFDLYARMGFPSRLTGDDTAYLRGLSRPDISVRKQRFNGAAKIEMVIPPHGVKMVQLRKIGP